LEARAEAADQELTKLRKEQRADKDAVERLRLELEAAAREAVETRQQLESRLTVQAEGFGRRLEELEARLRLAQNELEAKTAEYEGRERQRAMAMARIAELESQLKQRGREWERLQSLRSLLMGLEQDALQVDEKLSQLLREF